MVIVEKVGHGQVGEVFYGRRGPGRRLVLACRGGWVSGSLPGGGGLGAGGAGGFGAAFLVRIFSSSMACSAVRPRVRAAAVLLKVPQSACAGPRVLRGPSPR